MKPKGLNAIGSGGGEKDGKINLIQITFDINQVLTIETARMYMVSSLVALLDIINKNEKHRDYFDTFPVSVSNNVILISILGQDVQNENKNEVQYISIWKGKISYDVSTEIQELKPLKTIHKESFEEAQRILSECLVSN